ncbi:type II toxin-antitoxin system TacA family antitoxin [Acidiphilium multivorum]|nr:DUF1778 domain-containing protein [Acidiphilium multivorum]
MSQVFKNLALASSSCASPHEIVGDGVELYVLDFAIRCAIWQARRLAMATVAERKEYPISMRLPEADVAMIDRAASLRGRSRTDFVRDAAVRAAEEVVMEQGLIRMSAEGFAEFMDVLARPAAPVPEMVEVLKRPAPWEPGYVAKR